MSVHIKMDDNYQQTAWYKGTVNDKYGFVASMTYDSRSGDYEMDDVLWTNTPPDDKEIKYIIGKIKDFVMKWLFDKPKKEGEQEDA